VKLTTHLHLVPRSRLRGAIPPLPQYVFMAWCLVKHRDNFTFTFTFMDGQFCCFFRTGHCICEDYKTEFRFALNFPMVLMKVLAFSETGV
jgi:hypothetical protein